MLCDVKWPISTALLLAFSVLPTQADDSLPWWSQIDDTALFEASAKPEHAIDHYLHAKLGDAPVAPTATPEARIRRLTLDLVGRIPTVSEADAFLNAESPYVWSETIDRLLQSQSYERFLAHELNWLIADGKSGEFRDYLKRAVAEDRRWDAIFADVIAARPDSELRKGTDLFVRERAKDSDKLTNDVSVKFFGVNVSCAQCHDHPYVEDWTQDTYYGMKSFFNRTFENGGFVAEREYGLVNYKTVEGEERQPQLRFLGDVALNEPEHVEPDNEAKKAEKALYDKLKKEKKLPPPIEYSRRLRAIEAGSSDPNRAYFARSLVNQVWNRFFARGLVMPLDQMHGQNLPSHPELLHWLARDLIAHDYDLRRLIRGIAMSQAYQRSSLWTEGDRPTPELYAVKTPRALTPRQYGISIRIGTSAPTYFDTELPVDTLESRIDQAERGGEGMARWFERPGAEFHFPVDEALYFSNSSDARNQVLNSGLVAQLAKLESDAERITAAYQSTLSRKPAADELALFTDYLAARVDRSQEALGQLVWALVTSSEARFNH